MLIYFTLFSIPLLSFFIQNKYQKNILFCISYIYFSLFAGFRYEVGPDYLQYIRNFSLAFELNLLDYISVFYSDILFSTFYYSLALLFKNYNLILLFISLISIFPLFFFIKEEKYRELYLILFIPTFIISIGMNLIAQMLAASFFLISFFYTKINKQNLALLFFLFSIIFHWQIIIFAPLFIYIYLNNKIITFLFIAIAILTLMFFFRDFIINEFKDYLKYSLNNMYIYCIKNNVPIKDHFVCTKDELNQLTNLNFNLLKIILQNIKIFYVDSNYFTNFNEKLHFRGGLIRVSTVFFSCIFYLVFKSKLRLSKNEKLFLDYFCICAILLFPFVFLIEVAIDRIFIYFYIFQYIIMIKAIFLFDNNNFLKNSYIFLIILYSFLILYIWLNYGNNLEAWVPYKNYLFNIYS